MRYRDLFVASCESWLPPPSPTAEEVRAGLCSLGLAKLTGVTAVRASAGEAPPEMAVLAGRTALDHSRHRPQDIDLLLHAALLYQGHDMWAPASYVQREVVGNRCCLAIEIRQMSNGGMAALELAAAYLSLPGRTAALLTAADRFARPTFDRWGSDPGTFYADGAAAMVLSRRDGFARLASLASVSDPELEGMHRGDDPFATAPLSTRPTIDLGACQKAFLAWRGHGWVSARLRAGASLALSQALATAGTGLEAIRWFVLPHLGQRRLTANYIDGLGLDPERTTAQWSREVGHLGPADQMAGLSHLCAEGLLSPGDRCVLMGVGAGFTWSCAVLEIIAPPPAAAGTPE
jgi:3-oxoacyl-[acyl-carrier-protein] synthase III